MSPEVIDVVLPVRNPSDDLSLAINSVLADDAYVSRIIIVDDGSTNGQLGTLLSHIKSKKIKLIRQDALGIVAALNRGLAEAKAEFVARMDADDISLAGRFRKQIEFLSRNPSVAVVGAQAVYIDGAGKLCGDGTTFPCHPNEVRKQLFERGNCVVVHPSVMARRRALIEAGGYHPTFEYAEDFDLWLRLSERGQVANLPDTLIKYRRHRGQISEIQRRPQRFARDFALLCARNRARGKEDPANEVGGSPKIGSIQPLPSSPPYDLAHLLHGYHTVGLLEQGKADDICREDLMLVAKLASNRYFGERRRIRRKIGEKCANLLWQRGELRSSLSVTLTVLKTRIEESRAFRSFPKWGFTS